MANRPHAGNTEDITHERKCEDLLFHGHAAAAVLAAVLTQPAMFSTGRSICVGRRCFPLPGPPGGVRHEDRRLRRGHGHDRHPGSEKSPPGRAELLWSIPSHEDYPADQSNQVGSAAAGLVGLKILAVQSEKQADHKYYGVVDPTSAKPGDTASARASPCSTRTASAAGPGDRQGSGRPAQPRYVRIAGQDPTYIVEVKTDPLSTKFETGSSSDLLQINTMDMSRVQIRDYAIQPTREGPVIAQRRKMDLDYNDTADPKWKLAKDDESARRAFARRRPLGAGQSSSPTSSSTRPSSTTCGWRIDDLKIVEHAAQTAGFSADLKVSRNFSNRRQWMLDLQDKGFYAGQLGNGPLELYSIDGEVRVAMKDGVEYVLRFGETAGQGSAKRDDKAKAKGKKGGKAEEKDQEKAAGLDRYLLVMAQFNPKLIPQPKLEPLPEWKPEAENAGAKPVKAEEKKPKAKNSAKDSEGKKADGKKPAAVKPAGKAPPPAAQKAVETKPPAKTKEQIEAKQKPPAKTKEQIEAEKKAVAADRARIEKENRRKQDKYDRAVADGKKPSAS